MGRQGPAGGGRTTRIQWYPGHIAKAQRELKSHLGIIDAVIELADARVPVSSRFPAARSLCGAKPILTVLAKPDLALPQQTSKWLNRLQAVAIECRTGKGLPALRKRLDELKCAVDAKMAARGRLPRPVRLMVIGLPNVGKSSLINRLARGRKAVTGDKPGVTRAPGWIKLGGNLELMDTPGLLPPRLDDPDVALKLALTGALPTEAFDPREVAEAGLQLLARCAPAALVRFGDRLDLAEIAQSRGWLSRGMPDLERAAREVLHDIRTGAVGLVTLDLAE